MKTSNNNSIFKNPSRKACEQIIDKILTHELEQYGTNRHFKQASDFMPYFESLYPASPSLAKQVQRAINSMNLPRDDKGYLMIHKTVEEYQLECELSHMLQSASLIDLKDSTPFLLKINSWQREHVIYLLESIPDLQNLYDTFVKANNGVLIYTNNIEKIFSLLSDYMNTKP